MRGEVGGSGNAQALLGISSNGADALAEKWRSASNAKNQTDPNYWLSIKIANPPLVVLYRPPRPVPKPAVRSGQQLTKSAWLDRESERFTLNWCGHATVGQSASGAHQAERGSFPRVLAIFAPMHARVSTRSAENS